MLNMDQSEKRGLASNFPNSKPMNLRRPLLREFVAYPGFSGPRTCYQGLPGNKTATLPSLLTSKGINLLSAFDFADEPLRTQGFANV
jgi:hypothetical protein